MLIRFALALLLFGGSLVAQSTRFLHTDRWELGLGQSFSVGYRSFDSGGARLEPWPSHFEWFFVRGGGQQQNLDDPRVAPETRALVLNTLHPGISLIGADRRAFIQEVLASDFRLFLAQRVGHQALPAGFATLLEAETIRVRQTESAKVLIRVLGQEGFLPNSATAQSKTGQAVEIRPLADPTSVPVKSDLPLRIYVPKPGKAGTLVTARHLTSGRTQSFHTDAMGTGFFTITAAGVWVIEAHHARPVSPKAGATADWEIFSATLCFEVPPGDPRQAGDARDGGAK